MMRDEFRIIDRNYYRYTFYSIDIILKNYFLIITLLRIRRIGFKNQSWEYISRLIIVIIRTYKILEIKF